MVRPGDGYSIQINTFETTCFAVVTSGFLITTLLTAWEAYTTLRTLNSASSPSSSSGGAGGAATGASSSSSGGGRGGGSNVGDSPASIEDGKGGGMASGGKAPTQKGGRRQQQQQTGGDASASPASPPGGGGATTGSESRGDETREMFFVLLAVALASRLILLPVEAFVFHSSTISCLDTPVCIMTRTIPDLTFASAFSLLVLFYAQLAGLARAGGPRGLSHLLSRRGLFLYGNVIAYTFYFILLVAVFLGWMPLLAFQLVVYVLLCVLYGLLLFIMAYFAPVLVSLLRPSLMKAASSGLAVRLISMCVLCTVVFLSRTVCFALATFHRTGRFTHGIVPYLIFPPPPTGGNSGSEYTDPGLLLRDLLGYTLLELLPGLAILLMMHQRRSGSTASASRRRGEETTNVGGGPGAGGGGETRPLLSTASGQQAQKQGVSAGGYGGVSGGGGIRRVTSGSAAATTSSVSKRAGAGGTASSASGGGVRTSVSVGGTTAS